MIANNGKESLSSAYMGDRELGSIYIGEHLLWEKESHNGFKVRLTKFDGSVITYPLDGDSSLDLYEIYTENGKTFTDVKKLEVGEGVIRFFSSRGIFYTDTYIEELILPMSLKEYVLENLHLFRYNNHLRKIDVGGLETIQDYQFPELKSLDTLILNEGLKELQDACFSTAISLLDIEIPSTVTTIGSSFNTSTINGDRKVRIYCDVPPKVSILSFSYNMDYPIYVKDELVDTYKQAEGWGVYANRIRPMSEYK